MKDNNSKAENCKQIEDGENFNTIFDDVFRTIAQKMPSLLIPLINEVFGTKYAEDQEFEQLRNEHYEKFGKIITDSIIRIEEHLYHIECQSKKDGDMALRMVEYDFAIALEHFSKMEDNIIEINFPESCVLYIRNHRDIPNYHEAKVRFSDGQIVNYKVPVIMAQDYTINNIFEKHLLVLLPYHILRYEHFLKSNSDNQKKIDNLLNDYQKISRMLFQMREAENKFPLYFNLMNLINQIADYVIPKENPVRERIGAVMGGQVLQLASEKFIEEGRVKELYSMVQDGDTTPERAAKRLKITVLELQKQMQEKGYHFPEILTHS